MFTHVSGNYGFYIRFPAHLPWGRVQQSRGSVKVDKARTDEPVGWRTPKEPVAYMPTYIAANLQ